MKKLSLFFIILILFSCKKNDPEVLLDKRCTNYIIDSVKLYALKKQYTASQMLGATTSLGVVGYLFAGMFNDSVISVAPVFWIVLGVGVALNFMNREAISK